MARPYRGASSRARKGAVLLPVRGPPVAAFPSPRWCHPRRLHLARHQSPSPPVRQNACRARSSPRCCQPPPAVAAAPATCPRPMHEVRWWAHPAHTACARAGCAAARSPALCAVPHRLKARWPAGPAAGSPDRFPAATAAGGQWRLLRRRTPVPGPPSSAGPRRWCDHSTAPSGWPRCSGRHGRWGTAHRRSA